MDSYFNLRSLPGLPLMATNLRKMKKRIFGRMGDPLKDPRFKEKVFLWADHAQIESEILRSVRKEKDWRASYLYLLHTKDPSNQI